MTTDKKPIITIGIPCYGNVSPETLDDYMRFMYYLGRRYEEYDFKLAIKAKTEQFRARNAIVTAALQVGSKYLLMLDDDHVIDYEEVCSNPSPRYEFLRRLVTKLEESPENGIAGTLYYQRGGECKPVAMHPHPNGGYRWIRDDELSGNWQEVAVVGGGCMLLRCDIFDKIDSPWFKPELDLGTDIQICEKARNSGYKVFLDSSQVVGHVMHKREIVTDKNRERIFAESFSNPIEEGMSAKWQGNTALAMYVMDALEYTGMESIHDFEYYAAKYKEHQEHFNEYEDPADYYRSMGKEQLARQVWFHTLDAKIREFTSVLKLMNFATPYYGLDFGCGSAPFGYECAVRGHQVDFIDLDGAGGYEFLKWRCKKNGVRTAGFSWGGPYDYVMMWDSLEHIKDWQGILDKIIGLMKPKAYILTNYFTNKDFDNLEHISMDHEAVRKYLIDRNIFPVNNLLWIKQAEIGEEVYKNVGNC